MRAPTSPAAPAPRRRRLRSIRRWLLAALVPVTVAGAAASPAMADSAPLPGGSGAYVAVARDESGHLQVERFDASSSRQLSAEVASLDAAGEVLAVERDHSVVALGSTGADPFRFDQWALDRVPFEDSWSVSDGQGVVVAVVDSGVDAGHEDLAGAVLPGWDATTDRAGGGIDPFGHGTHVAGIIAARAANSIGTRGAAPGARILPVRVLRTDGSGSMADVAEGIVWAVDHGADVINLSLGGTGGGSVYRSVLSYARERGVVVVAAAGNEAQKGNPTVYPGADPDVIAVANVTPAGTRAPSSSFGPSVDLAAPGTGVAAPCPASATLCRGADPILPAGYAHLSGTSMATPHVAAAAALLLSARPDLTPAAVQALLEDTALDLGPPGKDQEYGAGLLDPLAALTRARPPAAPTPAPAPDAGDGEGGGYWVVGRDGQVAALGSAPDLGDVPSPAAPIVAAASTPGGQGYWLAGADGAVFAFGDAPFLGAMDGSRLNAPIVGMAATASGQGYWLLGADGGVFSFGDAAFYGSTGGMRLNRPVVDMAPTPSGQGYWLVATDGGVFSFGDAAFFGSTGSIRLNQPITSLAPADRGGYWLVARDGGIFAFGTAAYHGSLPGLGLAGLPEGRRIRTTAAGDGYYVLGADGRVFAFGRAAPHGSAAGLAAVDLLVAG